MHHYTVYFANWGESIQPTSIWYQTNIVFAGQFHNFNYIVVTV